MYVIREVLCKGRSTCIQYHPGGTVKTQSYIAEENTKEECILKQLDKNAYNDLILVQYYTVCFHIISCTCPGHVPDVSRTCPYCPGFWTKYCFRGDTGQAPKF